MTPNKSMNTENNIVIENENEDSSNTNIKLSDLS